MTPTAAAAYFYPEKRFNMVVYDAEAILGSNCVHDNTRNATLWLCILRNGVINPRQCGTAYENDNLPILYKQSSLRFKICHKKYRNL